MPRPDEFKFQMLTIAVYIRTVVLEPETMILHRNGTYDARTQLIRYVEQPVFWETVDILTFLLALKNYNATILPRAYYIFSLAEL